MPQIHEALGAAMDAAREAVAELYQRCPLPAADDVDACAMSLRVAAMNLAGVAEAIRQRDRQEALRPPRAAVMADP